MFRDEGQHRSSHGAIVSAEQQPMPARLTHNTVLQPAGQAATGYVGMQGGASCTIATLSQMTETSGQPRRLPALLCIEETKQKRWMY